MNCREGRAEVIRYNVNKGKRNTARRHQQRETRHSLHLLFFFRPLRSKVEFHVTTVLIALLMTFCATGVFLSFCVLFVSVILFPMLTSYQITSAPPSCSSSYCCRVTSARVLSFRPTAFYLNVFWRGQFFPHIFEFYQVYISRYLLTIA